MVQATCIQKFRDDDNRITVYRLQDCYGNTKDVTAVQLKMAIIENKIHITNLKLTSDYRLIDSKNTLIERNIPSDECLNNIAKKASVLGKLQVINTRNNEECYLIYNSNNEATFYIPSTIKNGLECSLDYSVIPELKNVEILRVIGGKGLQSMASLFSNCAAKNIDISNLETSNVTIMSFAFSRCNNIIGLNKINTSNVIKMRGMFEYFKGDDLDFSAFDTYKVTDMAAMFCDCKTSILDLSTLDTSNVEDMSMMFYNCTSRIIKLNNFNTSKVTNMRRMFTECTTEKLDLSSFNTRQVTDMDNIFCDCKSKNIELSTFYTYNVDNISNMFNRCYSKVDTTNSEIIRLLNKRR